MEKKEKNKKVTTINELVGIMLNAFDSNQKYMDKRFDQVDKKFETLTNEMNKNFREVTQKINNISRNMVDVVHREEFEKLETRVDHIENILNLPKK